MKYKMPEINRAEAIKWLLWGGAALIIILVIVYGIKKIRSWFGFSDEKEESSKEEKDVNVNIKLPEEVKGLLPDLSEKLERYIKSLRKALTGTFVARCPLYGEILANCTVDEISIISQAYEAAYKENLLEGVEKKYAYCMQIVGDDDKDKFIKELKKVQ